MIQLLRLHVRISLIKVYIVDPYQMIFHEMIKKYETLGNICIHVPVTVVMAKRSLQFSARITVQGESNSKMNASKIAFACELIIYLRL